MKVLFIALGVIPLALWAYEARATSTVRLNPCEAHPEEPTLDEQVTEYCVGRYKSIQYVNAEQSAKDRLIRVCEIAEKKRRAQ